VGADVVLAVADDLDAAAVASGVRGGPLFFKGISGVGKAAPVMDPPLKGRACGLPLAVSSLPLGLLLPP
jgi:hypothetical protein